MDRLGDDLTAGAVLVTGATGYLGQRILVELERKGITATGVTQLGTGEPRSDLTRPEAWRALMERFSPRVVIHCAAQVPKGMEEYANAAAARDSLAMVEGMITAQPAHIVFPSSMTVYRDSGPAPVREEDASDGQHGYAGGKKAAEDILLRDASGKVTILRLPGLFGMPRCSGFIYNAALAFACNAMPSVPQVAPLWAALHVDDAADMCVRAAVRKSHGHLVTNVGYDGRMSLSSVLQALARLFDRNVPLFSAPEFEMDLTRLRRELGETAHGFDFRLREVAALARHHARDPRH